MSSTTAAIGQNTMSQTPKTPLISLLIIPLLWGFFFVSLALIAYNLIAETGVWHLGAYIRINALSLTIFATVGFFGALISTYAKSYLKGFKYQGLFSTYSLGFIGAVILFVSANQLFLIVGGWFFMGFFMAKLIGINFDWGEARFASQYAFKYYLASSILLGFGLGLLAYFSNTLFLDVIISKLVELPDHALLVAALLVIVSGLIQSALFPFHRWLLSAMTAPTPASALMHAGFINGAGILFTIFASLLVTSNTLTLLFVLGGLTAICAQFVKLLQVNVKHKLACSTIAQMGFMVMQCGLGFFNAAIVHLILHGFYKAYLFLSSGEEIKMSSPHKDRKIKIKFVHAIVVAIFGVLGAGLFMFLTHKSSFSNTSIFLTLIVAITVGQATYNLMKQKIFPYYQRLLISIGLFVFGISMYAIAYNGIGYLLADLSFTASPHKLTTFEIIFGLIFLACFFFMKLGIYKNIPWLYVKLLNLSQPNKNTLFKFKN